MKTSVDFFLQGELALHSGEIQSKLQKLVNSRQQYVQLLDKLRDGFVKTFKSCKRITVADRWAMFQINWMGHVSRYLQLGTEEMIFFAAIIEDVNTQDNSKIVHSIAAGVFTYLSGHSLTKKKSEAAGSAVLPVKVPVQCQDELTLYTIGGACLGLIARTIRRRMKSKKSSEKSKREAMELRHLLNMVRMTKTQKVDLLPKALVERDRGGLFVPQRVFLSFLRLLESCMMEYVNEDAIEKYGKEFITVTLEKVKSFRRLRGLFQSAMEYVMERNMYHTISDSAINKFYLLWQSKYVHARLGEFVRGYFSKVAEEKGKLSVGGFNLRDDLYSVSARSKQLKK